jgi:copper chaperone CopZ
MKKIFKVENVDCAHCAMKMQNNIEKIDGVKSATLNFLTKRLTVEFDDAIANTIKADALAACRKVDRDVEIVE